MKKGKRIIVFVFVMLLSFSTSLYADVPDVNNVSQSSDVFRPFAESLANWYTTSDYDNIYIAGYKMPAKIEVKVIKGLFVKDKTMSSGEAALILDGRYNNQGIFINALNCQVQNEVSWQRMDGGKNWSSSVKIKGSGETYYSASLTKSEATNFLLSGGVEFKIKGVKVKTQSELNKTWGSSNTQTVSYKIDSSYSAYYDVEMKITGLGSISVSIR